MSENSAVKKSPRKSSKKSVATVEASAPVAVASEPEVMPALGTIEVPVTAVVREEAVTERKALHIIFTSAARRLKMIHCRSLFGIFSTIVWVVAQLREHVLVQFNEFVAEGDKLGINIGDETMMRTIIVNAVEAASLKGAVRYDKESGKPIFATAKDVERELEMLRRNLDRYDALGLTSTLNIDGVRAEMASCEEDLAFADGNDAIAMRALTLKVATLNDTLEEESIDNLEASLVKLLGPTVATPKIEKVWLEAKDAYSAKKTLGQLRYEAIEADKLRRQLAQNKARCTNQPQRQATRSEAPKRPAFQVHLL